MSCHFSSYATLLRLASLSNPLIFQDQQRVLWFCSISCLPLWCWVPDDPKISARACEPLLPILNNVSSAHSLTRLASCDIGLPSIVLLFAWEFLVGKDIIWFKPRFWPFPEMFLFPLQIFVASQHLVPVMLRLSEPILVGSEVKVAFRCDLDFKVKAKCLLR